MYMQWNKMHATHGLLVGSIYHAHVHAHAHAHVHAHVHAHAHALYQLRSDQQIPDAGNGLSTPRTPSRYIYKIDRISNNNIK